VQLKRKGMAAILDVQLESTTIAKRDAIIASKGMALPSTAWTFKIENNIGVLTLPTFSFWNSNFDWNKFLTESFAELNTKNIPHLIIDIRANEGGNGAISAAILANLLRTPYTLPAMRAVSAYERAPYQLVKHLDTWNYGFFDRTGQVEKTADNPPRYTLKSTQNSGITIQPVAAPYKGKTTVLIGAENSSATFQLAQAMQQSRVATLIGQPTAGNKRGLNSGEIAWVTLPNSGVAVDVPLLSSEPVEAQPDAGIVPDVVVPLTFAARMTGVDLEMAAALKAIAGRK
jgi:C-terminal processing protease CtpA/Prc